MAQKQMRDIIDGGVVKSNHNVYNTPERAKNFKASGKQPGVTTRQNGPKAPA